ncbi:hypothetical protein [Mesobacterium pallidum]|uniref:hypothetical protein n=1 Tax=Mesobacterium pallidum TaxID=2872037 RepID=UPI001EE2DDB1|nr:hypothetical protein [Mesobacterium pallidum]
MKIRRLTLTLPAHMRGTAEHDARAIAEALGRALTEKGAAQSSNLGPITLQAHGQMGPVLATRVAQAAKGGRHGG